MKGFLGSLGIRVGKKTSTFLNLNGIMLTQGIWINPVPELDSDNSGFHPKGEVRCYFR